MLPRQPLRDLLIIELPTRISAAKEEINMNYQIQGLSIDAEVHGTAEPALVFLHYWGGTSRTWIALQTIRRSGWPP
jgi:hypothetical protein